MGGQQGGVRVWGWVDLWGLEYNLGSRSLFYEIGLPLSWIFLMPVGWLVREPQNCACLHCPCPEICRYMFPCLAETRSRL